MALPTDQNAQSTLTDVMRSVDVEGSVDTPTAAPAAPVHPEVAPTTTQVARLPRRLGAMLYDGILLFALLMIATALLIVPYDLLAARPYPQGEWPYRTLLRLYLLAVILGFYVYFWTHGGQTLGMSTWRLRAVRDDGARLNARDALRRCAWAALGLLPAGLGLWWCLFDREHLAWYDRRSGTRLVVVPRGG